MSETHFNGPLKSGTKRTGESGGPNTGVAVLTQTSTITQNSTTAVSTTFYVPANSQIIDFRIDVLTAYDSGTSATLTIGTAAAGTQYVGSVNAKTAGRAAPTLSAAQLLAMADVTTNTSVVATVTPVGATAAGLVRVTLVYAQK